MPSFAPHNFSPERQPALKMFVADARRFVRATSAQYDVIVADLFHPARDGAGSLYTLEHFRAIRQRLASGGLFCQWLPLHQLDENMLRIIVRTFLEIFPRSEERRVGKDCSSRCAGCQLALYGACYKVVQA